MTSIDLSKLLSKELPNVDDTPLTFGKYKGRTPDDIADDDPGYIVWAYETIGNHICSKAMYDYCIKECRRLE